MGSSLGGYSFELCFVACRISRSGCELLGVSSRLEFDRLKNLSRLGLKLLESSSRLAMELLRPAAIQTCNKTKQNPKVNIDFISSCEGYYVALRTQCWRHQDLNRASDLELMQKKKI